MATSTPIDSLPLPTLVADAETLTVVAVNTQLRSWIRGGAPIGSSLTDLLRTEGRELCELLTAIGLETPLSFGAILIDSKKSVRVHACSVPDQDSPALLLQLDVACDEAPDAEGIPQDDPESALREQEIRFRLLADTVPVGIFLTNMDGRVMYVNERWSTITGLSLNKALLRGWLSGIHPDDKQRIEAAWTLFVTQPGPFDVEFRYESADGLKWVSTGAVTFHNEDGKPVGFLGTVMDITAAKEAEEQLRAGETRYRSIFDNILDVYYETSLSGEILELSPAIEAITSYTREELLGKQMLDFYADASARSHLLEALAAGSGEVHDYEIELLDKTGRPIPSSISCKLEYDSSGAPLKIIGSLRDITRRKSAEEMLRLERENLERIARDEPLPQILTGIVESVEVQAPGLLGSVLLLDPEGKQLHHGAAPSLPPDYCKAIDGFDIGPNVGSCGRAAALRACVIVEDIANDPLWIEFRELALEHNLRACWSQPILSFSGKVLGTFALYYTQPARPLRKHLHLIDAACQLAAIAIERWMAHQEQLNLEAQVRQTQKLESLGILAGGIAHDFNNLLTGVLGYASLALNRLDQEKHPARLHVAEIQKVAQRAAGLTKQMLAYSGKGKFVVRRLDLSEAVEDLAHLLEISISKKARMRHEFASSLPLVEADPAQVQQVVMNSIVNASEALQDLPGDIVLRTGCLHASREYLAESFIDDDLEQGDYVFIDIEDTGCGMDKATLNRIFDPFFTTKFTGRGLGMSAVLGIMRGHKGTIMIDSAEDLGTTVRLLFPAIPRDAEVKTAIDTGNTMLTQSDWKGEGTVLVVDDEDVVRNLAATIFAESGYRVMTAVDGEQCLDIYRKHNGRIDAILLDLTMPNKDGIETLHELRSFDSDVPVFLCSGYALEEIESRLNGAEFNGFIQKPYSRERLLDAIGSGINTTALPSTS